MDIDQVFEVRQPAGRLRQDISIETVGGEIVYRQVKLAARFATDPTPDGRLAAVEARCDFLGDDGRH